MLSSNAVFDSLRSSTFAEGDQAFVNTVLYGTFAINADVIQSLRKILEKTTLAAVSVPVLVPSWHNVKRDVSVSATVSPFLLISA
jgi:hypothetical protein